MTPTLILVTNDDGVHSPGLRALADSLKEVGDVRVVAPDREVSACSQSLTIKHPLRANELERDVYAVDGTPADCVTLALVSLLPRRPDLVVSGINSGANLGDDVFYSGTVGGAREACFFGVPAIAVSLAGKHASDFSHAAAFARSLAVRILEQGLPPQTVLNVNVPAGVPKGVSVTAQARRRHDVSVLERLDPRGREYYWIEEGRDHWLADEGSDMHAVREGRISVTPLKTDTTHQELLGVLQAWEETESLA